MAYQNWQQVKEIFADALRQSPVERAQFLDRVCIGDKLLRREVESLLSSFESAETFMEMPAVAEVADEVLTLRNRKFSNGQFLGHYEIIKQIGVGGMGRVYLAQDAKLNRRVALKVLHQNFLSDKQANERLLREARAAASLDHSNICQIYEISTADDCNFIVMQYVEGETLADILEKERLSVGRALALAIQIADALAEAHAHKIVHRDIKPANIIVNEKGQVKVLDFGLAKFIEAKTKEETAKKLSNSGAVMGTVPYMSPEQLRGKTLDARTDIFSFGALVYEMLSGRQAFSRENNAETISAILYEEPPLTVIPTKLQAIVKKSLMKEKTERYETAKDLTRDLYNLQQSGEVLTQTEGKFDEGFNAQTIPNSLLDGIFLPETANPSPKPPRFYDWTSLTQTIRVAPETKPHKDRKTAEHQTVKLNLPAVLTALAIIFTLVGATTWFAHQPNKNSDSHSFDSLRPSRLVSWKTGASDIYSGYSSSHDGKMIAYSSTQDGANEGIYVKQIADSRELSTVKDEWRNYSPIWSPDDQRLAFASYREGQFDIYFCPSLGGKTTLLKTIGDGLLFLRHWSKDGGAIFYEYNANLFRLDIATGEITQITNFTPSRIDSEQRYFSFSPDESQIAYCDGRDGQADVWVMPLNGGTPLRLTNDKEKESRPSWHPDGRRILYTVFRDNHYQINVAYLDGRAPEQVTRGESEHQMIDVSSDGTKIFYLTWENKSDIWAVKADSREEIKITTGIESEFWSDVSPDGKLIAFQTNAMPSPGAFLPESSIVIKSLVNQSVQLSLKGFNPRWLPDNRRVAFLRRDEEQKYNLWTVDTISGEEKIISNSVDSLRHSLLPYNRTQVRNFSWSPDSNKVIYSSKETGILNLRITSPQSNETVNILNNTDPNASYYSPLWSPDGSRIAYVSTQEGQLTRQEKPLWSVWLIEQGKPRKIFTTSTSLRLLGWSSEGELLMEMTDGVMKSDPLDIKLLQVSATGENQIVTIFKNIYALSMTLSADGKTVAFTSRQDGKDNIWTATTINGEARKITANADPKVFFGSLAWSPDGQTIYFDKQEAVNTISMFENFK